MNLFIYINPGEGTILWQVVIGMGMSALLFGKGIFISIKAGLQKMRLKLKRKRQ